MIRHIALAGALYIAALTQVAAHSEGHGSIGPLDALAVAVSATDELTRLPVERDWSPLGASWSQLSTASAKILAIVDGDYVVGVTNPEDGRVFYLLVAYNGTIVDANFTGTFPYVWDAQDPDSWTTD